MTRFRAAGIHLLISALVVMVFLALMQFVWYPNGFFKLLGGRDLLYIVAGVDITLGPLLTFVVFNSKKKSLKLDLTVIVVLQSCALLYGASVMLKARPVFNVFEEDLFRVVLASDFKDDIELKKASKPEWRSLSLTGPVIVSALRPSKQEDRSSIIGRDWSEFPRLYVDYDGQRSVAIKASKPLSSLSALNKANAKVVSDFLAEAKLPESAYRYVPIVRGLVDMAAILDAKTGDFVEIVEAKTP